MIWLFTRKRIQREHLLIFLVCQSLFSQSWSWDWSPNSHSKDSTGKIIIFIKLCLKMQMSRPEDQMLLEDTQME